MKLIEQPNRWTCQVTALAMLLDAPLAVILAEIGHDGSRIIDSTLPEPKCRRSFVMAELQDVCYFRGYSLVPFEADPILSELEHIYDEDIREARIKHVMDGRKGLIEGAYSLDNPHMTAWDGREVFDPAGPRRYKFPDPEGISILCFWLLV